MLEYDVFDHEIFLFTILLSSYNNNQYMTRNNSFRSNKNKILD
jgi:hypothetical protein